MNILELLVAIFILTISGLILFLSIGSYISALKKFDNFVQSQICLSNIINIALSKLNGRDIRTEDFLIHEENINGFDMIVIEGCGKNIKVVKW